MAQQLQQVIPDKQALVSVLNYLRDKQLKETEEVLKRELGLEGVSPMDTSSASSSSTTSSTHLPPVPQSDTEPAKYQESYSRTTPSPSPSTEADLQPTATTQPGYKLTGSDTTTREHLLLQSDKEDNEQDSDDENEEDENDDITDSSDTASLQAPENHRPLSWPGSLPQQHTLLKFPRPEQVILNNNKAPLRVKISPSAPSVSTPLRVLPPLPATTVPLWASSTSLKPLTVTTSLAPTPSSSSQSLSAVSSVAARLDQPQSVIYSMLGSQSLSQQPLITPLFTIVPSTALMSTTATSGVGNSATKPLLKPSPPPLILSPQCRPTTLPTLTRPVTSMTLPRTNSSSSPNTPQAEPATGQTIISPSILNKSPRTLGSVPPQRTLASIPPSEMTPHYIELKAFAEEFKTKRIRLGYTQGSVGQSLARRGYSNFAQSTISRFEQMQLSATNAAAIKQVLEKWLQETEFPESVPSSSSDVPVMASRKRKKRAVFTPQTKSTLEEFFHQNPRPNRQAIESIAQKLDLLPEEVRVWFCNKRQKQKSSTSSASSYYSTVSSPASSSNSPGSSGFVAIRSPSLSPRRRSPSPKTSFTIEELSKSASNSTSSTPSPVLLTSPFSVSPSVMSFSASGGVFPLVLPTHTLPNMTAQTKA